MANTVLILKDFRGRARRITKAAAAGFTLIEILVVLAIIGLLVGLVAPHVLGQLGDAKVKTAHIQIESFKNALDIYFIDMGRYPNSREGLLALEARPSGTTRWSGPYIKGDSIPKDPWDNAYLYRSPGQNGRPYDIISLGPQGQEGGAGAQQITSW